MYYAIFDRIAPAQNKHMLVLWNGTANRKVVVNRIYRYNWQTGAVTGVMLEQELREITARAGTPTNVAIQKWDTTDPDPTAGIVCEHTGTATPGGRGLLHRVLAVNEEIALTTSGVMAKDFALLHDAQLVYWRQPGRKGLTLATGRGLTIQNITNSTLGSVSYRIEFDDEPA